MSRSTTLTLKQAVFAQETDQVFLMLLEIDHADLGAPLRFVNNKEDIFFMPAGAIENIVNGGFDTDTNWTKQTGWSIAGGVASHDGTGGNPWIYQSAAGWRIEGQYYRIIFDLLNYSAGSVTPVLAGQFGTERNANGNYIEHIISGSGNNVTMQANANLIGDIDNISAKLVYRYIAYPFDIFIPEDTEEKPPQMMLTIDNVSREIIDEIRSITGPPTVALSVVLASDADTIEAGPFNMVLRNADYDQLIIQGALHPEDILNEPFPGDSMDPIDYPGLY